MACESSRSFNSPFRGPFLSRVAFPLGGIGAGMICLEGTGALSHVSVRNAPDIFNEPVLFGALHLAGRGPWGRIIEGPVPEWKTFGPPLTGNGASGRTYGLPRFEEATFDARFPFATVDVSDPQVPLRCSLTGWSPFVPNEADDSSLPIAVLEYEFENPTDETIDSVFSFHAANFMARGADGASIDALDGGFVLRQAGSAEEPVKEGAFAVTCLEQGTAVDCAWFRGGWFDSNTILWRNIETGATVSHPPLSDDVPSPGGSVYVPFSLSARASKRITVLMAWYVPRTDARHEADPQSNCEQQEYGDALDTYVPWYAGKFDSVEAVVEHARIELTRLRARTARFRDCFQDTTLPPEVIEAVAANLSILKSPTVLRQTDGRLWCWEGCHDGVGCCSGSCTHVWNYAQALPHLFHGLERGMRDSEFQESQDNAGHQVFRVALPIRSQAHVRHAAADGQLGGIMKVYREWRIGGDTQWLRGIWPRVRSSIDYCIATWDPDGIGVLVEPHHNTYDIEFWGPDGMCASFYLGALKAAMLMGEAIGDDVARYADLFARGRAYLEQKLFDGEYFVQDIQWKGLRAGDPSEAKTVKEIRWTPEAVDLLRKEGPKYQYGKGCLADGVLGAWIAAVCGIGEILDTGQVKSHLRAVHRHNLKRDLADHVNPQRPGYAFGREGGLLLCTWPKGGELSLPFVYSNEVWTGIEYHVASHLMLAGCAEEGLEIVRMARSRYDGRRRNPFNEYECGHFYARALSSYGLLQGLTGARYDAVEKVLHLEPQVEGDFRSFLCTATGYGTVGVKNGEPFFDVAEGCVTVDRLVYKPVT